MADHVPDEVLLILGRQVSPLKMHEAASVSFSPQSQLHQGATYEDLGPREVDVGDFREVPNRSPSLQIARQRELKLMCSAKNETYPDGVVRVLVRAFREVERRLRRRVVRAAALVVVVHARAVALEVRDGREGAVHREGLVVDAEAVPLRIWLWRQSDCPVK